MSGFQDKDGIIWDKLNEAGALDSICDLFKSIPKWAKVKHVHGKTTPRVESYAAPAMSDAEAMERGFSLNPNWLKIRMFVAEKFLAKYVVTRSASVNRDESDPKAKGLPSPEEQLKVEGEIIDMNTKRDLAQRQQLEHFNNLKNKRSS